MVGTNPILGKRWFFSKNSVTIFSLYSRTASTLRKLGARARSRPPYTGKLILRLLAMKGKKKLPFLFFWF